jgi:uncharacterized protein YgbK (DUF1537 family)
MIGLVADDLTGACDSAVAFVEGGRVEVGIWPHIPRGDLACAATSTESRMSSPQMAFDRSRHAADRLRAGEADTVYLKVDSMLRGNVAASLAGTLQGHQGPCLFAPALPSAGRITVRGRQRWGDHDIDLLTLLAHSGRPVCSGSPEERHSGWITVCDAATPNDLTRVAQVAATTADVLPAGTAGLAHHLGQAMLPRRRVACPTWPTCIRPAAVVGSTAARAQGEHAQTSGCTVFWSDESGPPPDVGDSDGLLLTGGYTASRVLRSLGAIGLEVLGEALPLMPIGLIIGGSRDGLPVALKAGAFGRIDAISSGLARLAAGG